jgi:hypothetical protein
MKATDYLDSEEIARGVLGLFEEAETEGMVDPSQAYVFSIKGDEFRMLGSGGDIYDLISEQISTSAATVGDGDVFGCFTRGWAAPTTGRNVENEPAPSEHPDRKRVLLVAIVTDLMEMASAMRMNGEEVITTTEGAGSLADALKETFTLAQIIAKHRNN